MERRPSPDHIYSHRSNARSAARRWFKLAHGDHFEAKEGQHFEITDLNLPAVLDPHKPNGRTRARFVVLGSMENFNRMITPTPGHNHSNTAIATCDECGCAQEERCSYEKKGAHFQPNAGQIIRRLTTHGWTMIKGKLRCPTCSQAMKGIEQMPNDPAVDDGLRHPSREMKRQIIEMLTAVYDTRHERYMGAETDKTVAEAIGNGCMFGWVAQIREELFGPAGGNEEIESLRAELDAWALNIGHLVPAAQKAIEALKAEEAKIPEFRRRLEAISKAVGPRAATAKV